MRKLWKITKKRGFEREAAHFSIDTIEAVRALIAEAIGFHIEGLRASGEVVRRPSLIFLPVESDSEISYEFIAARF